MPWHRCRYGVAFGAAGQLFVSNQDTNAVTTASYSAAVGGSAKNSSPFFKLGKGNGVRGLAADARTNLLFVADSDNDKVHALDAASGKTKFKIDISSPIGLFLDASSRELFIGSHDKHDPMVAQPPARSRAHLCREPTCSTQPAQRRFRFGRVCCHVVILECNAAMLRWYDRLSLERVGRHRRHAVPRKRSNGHRPWLAPTGSFVQHRHEEVGRQIQACAHDSPGGDCKGGHDVVRAMPGRPVP